MKEEFFGNERIASSVLPSMTGMLKHIDKYRAEDRIRVNVTSILNHIIDDHAGYEIFLPGTAISYRYPKATKSGRIANPYAWLANQLTKQLESPRVLKLEPLSGDMVSFTYTSWSSVGELPEDGHLIIHPTH